MEIHLVRSELMKKILLGALVAGTMVLPLTNVEAYHVIKQHKTVEPVAVTQPAAVTQSVAVVPTNEGMSASATAHTDRALISEEAPASVRNAADNKIAPVAPAQGAYLMRGGDQLQLIVYGHDDLSNRVSNTYGAYIVRPDGYLSVPLIGDVFVKDKTLVQVTKEISNRLAEFIIDPQVTINIVKLGTTRVYVFGQTKQQGIFELDKTHNLIDAVGAAGGFTSKAAKRNVYLVRNGVDNFVTKVNILDLLKHADSKCNPLLNEGDMIYVSSNHKLAFNQVATALMHLTEVPYYVKRVENM